MEFNEDFEEDFEPVLNNDNNSSVEKPLNENFDDTLMEFKPVDNVEQKKEKVIPISDINIIKIDDINKETKDIVSSNIEKDKIKNQSKEKITPISEVVLSNNISNSDSVNKNNKADENVSFPEMVDSNAFSNELNKLKVEQEILNMNPELKKENKRKVSVFEKYAVVLPIFAFISTLFLGVYLFINKTNAEEINLIKIEQNNKVGYIDKSGSVVVRPKYMSGTDFYKGYAIVKNHNSLSAVINGKSDLVSPFGNYFYIERFNNRYIASKFTSDGLKLALLDSNLNEVTKYKYDNISYAKNNTFLFTRDDTMGVLNKDGNEIYTYMVDEIDDKNVTIEISNTDSDDDSEKYAKIKVNNSSTIINLSTGKKVYKYTLDDIYVLDNNVFYVKSKDRNLTNNKYIVIKNDSVALETQNYKKVRVDKLSSNIAVCVNEDSTYDYINLNNRKKINSDENIDYYYSDGLILTKTHNFNTNDDEYVVQNNEKVVGRFKNYKPVNNEFENDMIKVYVDDEKYNYVSKQGKLLNNEKYDYVSDFDKFGYAIVSKNGLYGVVNNKGKEVVSLNYSKIELLDEDLFSSMHKKYNKDIFVYYENDKCGLIASENKIIVKAIYDSFKYITTEYPIIIGKFDSDKIIINIDSAKEFNIDVQKDVSVYENYIIIDKDYYNYDGKKIYSVGEGV